MSGGDIAVILAAALTGGGAAFLAWEGARHFRRGRPAPVADAPAAMPAAMPEDMAAQLDALREEVAAITRRQLDLLNDQAAREGRVLAEMRAAASSPPPEVLSRLRRIEALLDGTPPGTEDSQDGTAPPDVIVLAHPTATPSPAEADPAPAATGKRRMIAGGDDGPPRPGDSVDQAGPDEDPAVSAR